MPLPNLLIIGAPKAGTTMLKHAFMQHPDIYLPETQVKEPHFLSYAAEGRPSWAIQSEDAYSDLFVSTGEHRYICEKSTWYLSSAATAEETAKRLPQCRAIAALRDPVARAFSHFVFNRQHGWENQPSFAACLRREEQDTEQQLSYDKRYFEAGLYGAQLPHWHTALGKNCIHHVLQEDLLKFPDETFSMLFKFLDLPLVLSDKTIETRQNVSTGMRSYQITRMMKALSRPSRSLPIVLRAPIGRMIRKFNTIKKPQLDPKTGRELAFRFQSDVSCLSDMLGQDLNKRWLEKYL